MTDPITLPEELQNVIGSETTEFVVTGKQFRPLKGSLSQLITYDRDQFIQKTSVTGNAIKGNLTLTRTTGYQTKRNQAGMSYYIPYIVFISGIPAVFEIEKICKQRIKESDTLFPN